MACHISPNANLFKCAACDSQREIFYCLIQVLLSGVFEAFFIAAVSIKLCFVWDKNGLFWLMMNVVLGIIE